MILATKNHLFRWSSFWSWRICKQSKLSHLRQKISARNPKRVTVWCRFWSRGIIGLFFFENEQAKAVTINGNRYRAMLNEFLFKKIDRKNIFNRTLLRATQPKLHLMFCALFWRSHYQPQSCYYYYLYCYLWGAVKDKCFADKPKTIQALKDNIREAIYGIQLNTIDNVLKNRNDRVGYCMASWASHLNEIIFLY